MQRRKKSYYQHDDRVILSCVTSTERKKVVFCIFVTKLLNEADEDKIYEEASCARKTVCSI